MSLVADANVVLSALIGGRARLVIAAAAGPRCVAADAVAAEIARHLPRLAQKRGLDVARMFAALQVMPIDWQPEGAYAERREEALALIGARDPDDWPTLGPRAHARPAGMDSRTRTTPTPASRPTPPASCWTR